MRMPIVIAVVVWVVAASSMRAADAETARDRIHFPQTSFLFCVTIAEGKLQYRGDTPLVRRALSDAKKAIAITPDSIVRLTELIDHLERVGDVVPAKMYRMKLTSLRRKAVADHPDDFQAHLDLHNSLPIGSDEGEIDRAMKLAPNRHEPYLAKANLHSHRNQTDACLAALKTAVSLAPETDFETRMTYAYTRTKFAADRVTALKATPAIVPAGATSPANAEALRAVAADDLRTALSETNDLVIAAGKRFQTDNGQCGLDTRARCMGLLVFRDTIRGIAQSAEANDKPKDQFQIYQNDTADLVGKFLPPTLDDPHALFMGLFVGLTSRPIHTKSNPGMSFDPEAKKLIQPYLDRLKILSTDPDPEKAATAAWIRGFSLLLMAGGKVGKNPAIAKDVYEDLRTAIRLAPTFDLPWGLLIAELADEGSQEAISLGKEWIVASGTALSYYGCAKAMSKLNKWAEAEKYVEQGLFHFPNDILLQHGRIACDLRSESPIILERAAILLTDVSIALRRDPGSPFDNYWRNHTRLAAISAAIRGDRNNQVMNTELYARYAESPEDLQAIRTMPTANQK